MKIIYLSVPYSFNPSLSFIVANQVAAKLMQEGNIVFSPVSHSHKIADYLSEEIRLDHQFWMDQDLPMMDICTDLFLVRIGECGESFISLSRGCQKEIERANQLNLDITYYDFD